MQLTLRGTAISRYDNGLEHRWGDRICVTLPVRFSTAVLSSADGCLQNLSLSGALMQSRCELRLHALIEIRMNPLSPSAAANGIGVKGHVARLLEDGAGIEWCEFAPQPIKDLLRIRW